LSAGYTISANYTWSHCISDVATSEFRNSLYTNPADRRYDRGNCATGDRRHLLNVSAVMSAPRFANRLLENIAGNWRMSLIYRYQSAPYLTLSSGVDTALNGIGGQRANLVLPNAVADNPTQDQYFAPGAFAQPANGTFGNLGPSNILGRGTFNLDMGLTRGFRVREAQRIEVRAESFSLLNHPILGQPNTTLNGTSFGKTTSATGERILQFALKYTF
jgi:hypothetical protein